MQPIVVTTTVFAVFIRSGLERTRPDLAEVVWALCTVAGLTLFVVSAGLRAPHRPPAEREALLVLAVGALLAVAACCFARSTLLPARRGFLLGLGAGILYGLTAGLVKLATSPLGPGPGPGHGPGPGPGPGHGPGPGAGPGPDPGLWHLLGHWPVWLVPVAGLSAFLISQRAYQATRLSVSAPVLNMVDVLVAVTFGAIVFGDRLFTTPGRALVEVLGITMMAVGVWRLVREDERLHARRLRSAAQAPSDASAPARRQP